jgi:hypothetical protein
MKGSLTDILIDDAVVTEVDFSKGYDVFLGHRCQWSFNPRRTEAEHTPTQPRISLSASWLATLTRAGYCLLLSSYALSKPPTYRMVDSKTLSFFSRYTIIQITLART